MNHFCYLRGRAVHPRIASRGKYWFVTAYPVTAYAHPKSKSRWEDFMRVLIDDFAWIAIGLVFVAFLFTIGAAYILIAEGLKFLVRSFRKIAGTASQRSEWLIAGLYRVVAGVGRVLQEMVEDARLGTDLRLRLRHHKL